MDRLKNESALAKKGLGHGLTKTDIESRVRLKHVISRLMLRDFAIVITIENGDMAIHCLALSNVVYVLWGNVKILLLRLIKCAYATLEVFTEVVRKEQCRE